MWMLSGALVALPAVARPTGEPARGRGAEVLAGQLGLAIPVDVVNDEDEPVPVAGTVNVGNLPAVQSVEVSGSPTVHVASMPPVAVTSGELPFQWAGLVQLGPGDVGSDCIELLPSDLPAGMALAVEQIAAVARFGDPAAEAHYFVRIPVPTPEDPDAEALIFRDFLDLTGNANVLEEKALLGGPGGATQIAACAVGPDASMHFRLFGRLVPVTPPPS